jgi:ribosomal protein L31
MVVSVAVAALCSACGGSGSTTESTGAPPALTATDASAGPTTTDTTTTAAAAVDDGCSDTYPRRLLVSGAIGSQVSACAGDGGISVENTSAGLVIVVSSVDPGFSGTVVVPSDQSFSDSIVTQTIHPACYQNGCFLTPGATLDAVGSAPLHVTLQVAKGSTADATVASYAASWVQTKLSSRSEQLRESIVHCGTAAQNYVNASTINDAVRQAIDASADCHSLYRSVDKELSDSLHEAKDEGDVLATVDKFTENLHRDFDVYAAVDLIDHLHR